MKLRLSRGSLGAALRLAAISAMLNSVICRQSMGVSASEGYTLHVCKASRMGGNHLVSGNCRTRACRMEFVRG